MYKKDDYMAFMTKKPHAHLNEMFGHNDLTEDDFEKEEYKGSIVSVIDESHYLMRTISPLDGFYCTVPEEDILRKLDPEELTEKEKEEKVPVDRTAPNVYYSQSEPQGETIAEKCENRAREAMKVLFPDVQITGVNPMAFDLRKEDMLKSVAELPSLFDIKGKENEYEEFRDWFEKTLREKHFKEYYTFYVGVYGDAEKTCTVNWLAAVDMKLEEVVIMRDIVERTRFFRSLGPDYDDVYSWKMNFTHKLLSQE